MEDDPVMATDNRHIGLVGTTDGAPFFKDMHRGCWPFVFRVANLPDGLSHLTRNTHVGLISANEYISTDPLSGQVVRWVRAPKSLHPHMLIISDDLYAAYHSGNTIIDWTIPRGVPGRSFCCRTRLLLWTGDYPALGKSSGMKHKGRRLCHWCNIRCTKDKSTQRQVVSQYRRYLPSLDPKRSENWAGGSEKRAPPKTRTHAEIVRQAKENVTYEGYQKDAPHHESGITEVCPLSWLHLFCMCWDFAPDMFHAVEGILQTHIVPLMKGLRRPKKPRRTANVTQREWQKIIRGWESEKENVIGWELPDDVLKVMDDRARALGGETGWFGSGRAVCKRTGSLKAYDWLKIAEGAWQYLFWGLYDESPHKQESLYGLMTAIQTLIGAVSHAENPDIALDRLSSRTDMLEIKNAVANGMALFDRDFPATEKAGVFHILLHFPDFIHKWGSVRNGWCFYGERSISLSVGFSVFKYLLTFSFELIFICKFRRHTLHIYTITHMYRVIGWLMRFIKNRDMAVENIVTAMSKNSAVCQLPPGIVGSIRSRIAAAGIRLPPGSMLKHATEVFTERGSLPGSYTVSVKKTRFTCRRRNVPRTTLELKKAATDWCLNLRIGRKHIDFTTVKELLGGVTINGRPYKQQSHCEIAMPVPRSHPELAGDRSTFKVATIHKFYTLQIRDEEVVFVELSTHKEKGSFKDIRIVRRLPKTRRRTLSVDNIRHRLKFAPHWDDEITNRVCAIRMWTAL